MMPCSRCGAPIINANGGRGQSPVPKHLLGSPPYGCIRFLRRQVDELREELEEIRDES